MARKTGGRKKVTANELKKLIAQLQASGNLADKARLDLMLEIMRDVVIARGLDQNQLKASSCRHGDLQQWCMTCAPVAKRLPVQPGGDGQHGASRHTQTFIQAKKLRA